MATIKRELSKKINGNGKSEILLRLSAARGVQPRIKSGIFIDPARFNDGGKDPRKTGTIMIPRANQKEAAELRRLEADLIAMEQYLLDLCLTTPKEQLNNKYIITALDTWKHPEIQTITPVTFFETFDQFLVSRALSVQRQKNYRVLIRALKRYEAYRMVSNNKSYAITLDGLNSSDITDFEAFLRKEPEIAQQYPEIYEANPADTRQVRKTRKPQPKGNNAIACLFSLLRSFYNWCNGQGITDNKPFARYNGVTTEKYGTPYYITIEERDVIAEARLSSPVLERQRDVFIFQCLIGCRVSDLMRLTKDNIIRGAVEYIASKTKGERPEVIRVPLHDKAVEILKRYDSMPDGRLLPFVSQQRYNEYIKQIFAEAGITRVVTVLNPTTGLEEQRHINEIASSHLARRTFVGNLYKKVKDPNLVGKLSGHKEGSRAFARYRDIDEDMKRDLINLL